MYVAEAPRPAHGGDIARIAERYGVDGAALLDFSVNVNPLGAPRAVLDYLADGESLRRALGAYPDREARALKEALTERYEIPAEAIVVGNGSAALLDAVLRALPPGPCLVPVPAFSEYARAIAACGYSRRTFPLDSANDFRLDVAETIAALQRERPGVLILTNPHNPSGALCGRDALRAIVRAASAVRCTVLLDEAFIDYAPAESLTAEAAEREHLVVLRSLTKFFAMPAMRVGYAVAVPQVARRIEACLPSWPVGTFAIEAGARALRDRKFEERSIAQNDESRDALACRLRELGLRVLPSAANFLMCEIPASWGARGAICERLVRSWGIVVRDCGDYEGCAERSFVRVGVKDRTSNERLVRAFRSLSPLSPREEQR